MQVYLDAKKDEIQKMAQERTWLETQLHSKEGELEELKKTINNLQRAMQQQQEEHEQIIRVKERQAVEDRSMIQQLEFQNQHMKDKIRE